MSVRRNDVEDIWAAVAALKGRMTAVELDVEHIRNKVLRREQKRKDAPTERVTGSPIRRRS